MQTLRGSLTNIPNTVTNLIGSLPTPSSIMHSSLMNRFTGSSSSIGQASPPSSISGDDSSEKSQAIPSALIKEQWQLVLGQNASVDDLENAIERCKELVLNTDECSPERKWLVRHLVELRFRLKEIQDVIDDPRSNTPNTTVILGHHFIPGTLRHAATSRQYCDHCSGIIWSVVQASYVCKDCHYCAHHKCVQNIVRICAHVISSERKDALKEISPEIGLAMQSYKCAECETPLNFTNPGRYSCLGRPYTRKPERTWMEARLCDYTGLYYCPLCHWNDTISIPARIVHNWDFSHRKVARASLQELNLIQDRAVIKLEQRNPKLFIYVHNLSIVHKLRENLMHMRQYLSECRIASGAKLLDNQIGTRRHLIQSTHMYSLADLVGAESGTLIDFLNKLHQMYDGHIRKCDICMGKGFLCEICGNNEPIFPYDDAAVQCDRPKCLTIFHRACWIRKNMICTKCIRVEQRQKLQELAINEEDDVSDVDNN